MKLKYPAFLYKRSGNSEYMDAKVGIAYRGQYASANPVAVIAPAVAAFL